MTYRTFACVLLLVGCGTGEGGDCSRSSDCAGSFSCVGGVCTTGCTFLYSCSSSDELCLEDRCVRSLPESECDVVCTGDDVCMEDGRCCDVGPTNARCQPGCSTEDCAQDCADGSCCGDGTCDFNRGERNAVCPDDCEPECEDNDDCEAPLTQCVIESGMTLPSGLQAPDRGVCAESCVNGQYCFGGFCLGGACEPGTPGDECLVECDDSEFCVNGRRCCLTDLGTFSCSYGCANTADCELVQPGSNCTSGGRFRPNCTLACDGSSDRCAAENEGCRAGRCTVYEPPTSCASPCLPIQVCVGGTECCFVEDDGQITNCE